MQNTSHLLMIRPVNFGYNAQTAVNNSFQVASEDANTAQKAIAEFDAFVQLLRQHHIDVTVVEDTLEPHTPDSIFPNNWISFHSNGTITLYPMFAVNRRLERKNHVLEAIQQKFTVTNVYDLTATEQEERFLEGTGSMVLDREKQIAYACISPRTDEPLLLQFCEHFHYTPIAFVANDSHGKPIYHTNVMMCVAAQYVVICLDAITDATEKEKVKQAIHNSGKTVIPISFDQMNHFAGNMLQVKNGGGLQFLIMSTQAYESLTSQQIQAIEAFNPIIHSPINTIETNGGGSARCMMAEVFLPLL